MHATQNVFGTFIGASVNFGTMVPTDIDMGTSGANTINIESYSDCFSSWNSIRILQRQLAINSSLMWLHRAQQEVVPQKSTSE